MEFLTTWQQPLLWASGLSVLAVVGGIIAVPWVVVRLPQDYFAREERVVWRTSADQSLLVLVVAALKNLLGLLLVILGLIMLVTPGQGILTLLIGLMLMNFPGKYRVERWLVLRSGVLRALNWLREKRGHPPFDTPQQNDPIH
jgi:Putative transmembrane protein (PGPGW)